MYKLYLTDSKIIIHCNMFISPDCPLRSVKLYVTFIIAGSAYFPAEGTTNLHLDVSDAVNVMVFVGIPDDGPGGKAIHESAALQAIDNAGCDIITKRRVREVYEVPGALWHIFDAIDADKMRDFLNMVSL